METGRSEERVAPAALPTSGFFHPDRTVSISRRNLPHWRQEGVWYFVTYRLADALPVEKVRALEAERAAWRAAHPEPRSDAQMEAYRERFSEAVDDLLDAGSGACWLRRSDVRAIVTESLLYGAGTRYDLDAWVIMPNHVHALVMPLAGADLSKILHTWKSFTAKRINHLLERAGTFWQNESYNHIVRDPAAFAGIRRYILANPAKANLPAHAYTVSSEQRRGV